MNTKIEDHKKQAISSLKGAQRLPSNPLLNNFYLRPMIVSGEVNIEAIPKELRKVEHWVAWKKGNPKPNGKRPKIPMNPNTGESASPSDPQTWGPFEKTCKFYIKNKKRGCAGIGFVFNDSDPYWGMDLDHCRNKKTGELSKLARDVLSQFDTYAEISPSGTGIKLIGKGKLPGKGIHTDKVELYDCKRFFTITGWCLGGHHIAIKDKSSEIADFYNSLSPPQKEEPKKTQAIVSSFLTDNEVIAKATNAANGDKFTSLMEGDSGGYNNDNSAADQALISMLSYRTGGNVEQIDRIFRRSKLFRPKWDEKHHSDGSTYGQMTIRKAMEFCQNYYQPVQVTSAEIIKALDDVEQGDANLFIKTHQNRFCFDHSAQQWYLWEGNYWIEDLTNQALASVMDVVDIYQRERDRLFKQQFELPDSGTTSRKDFNTDLIKRIEERIAKLKSQHKREHILKLASAGRKSLGITGNEWDSKPWLLACSNGVLSLKGEEVTFRAGLPSDYIKTFASVEWQGVDTKAPLWKAALKEIFEDDRKLINHVRKLLGYALSGSAQEHIFIIFAGIGRNGKSTIIEVMKHVLGALSDPIPSETLLTQTHSSSGAAPRADLMKLRGLRLAWASESNEERRFNAGLIKQLTGGDTITARGPFGKKMISFRPMHTIFFLTNHVPHIAVDEYAFWQRIHLIPFNVSFVAFPKESHERKVDKELAEKLKTEASGILAWLVRGCLRWQKHGLKQPKTIQNAIGDYRHEEDIIGRFLEECFDRRSESRIGATKAYDAYKQWCDDNDTECWSQTKFGKEMGKRFKRQLSNGNYYLGLHLKKKKKYI